MKITSLFRKDNVATTSPFSLSPQVSEVKKMKIGDPLDRSTDHGPQNHKAHLDSLLSYVEKGVSQGATLVYGGKRIDRPGKDTMEGAF